MYARLFLLSMSVLSLDVIWLRDYIEVSEKWPWRCIRMHKHAHVNRPVAKHVLGVKSMHVGLKLDVTHQIHAHLRSHQ